MPTLANPMEYTSPLTPPTLHVTRCSNAGLLWQHCGKISTTNGAKWYLSYTFQIEIWNYKYMKETVDNSSSNSAMIWSSLQKTTDTKYHMLVNGMPAYQSNKPCTRLPIIHILKLIVPWSPSCRLNWASGLYLTVRYLLQKFGLLPKFY